MAYYHIYIEYVEETQKREYIERLSDLDIHQLIELINLIKKGKSILLQGWRVKPKQITAFQIWETEEKVVGKESPWKWIEENGKEVTRNFIISIDSKLGQNALERSHRPTRLQKSTPSKNVFIVHGRDHEPVKQLKTILCEFGLNPIVLHEQPSGSRTIVEKLEKHSDVGYAFVILTPDDAGAFAEDILKWKHYTYDKVRIGHGHDFELKPRARQNVVLEFGYFIGLLGRDRVCCLHKGNVELPSDMHGIVYIPFKNSVNEAKSMITKELKEAGYEITI